MENRTTKTEFSTTSEHVHTHALNDIAIRLILIPFFGISIPIVTGLIDHSQLSNWEIKFSYIYTIALAFVVWQGNRYLLFTLRSYFDWFNKPVRKIIALLVAISVYTIPLSCLMLTGWYYVFRQGNVLWDVVFTCTLLIMICVIFITHVYETVFLVKDSESEMLKSAQLEKAKAQAELQALKYQIDPHFLFNSLNTLSHLIEQSPLKAKHFNDTLADVYRYLLHMRSKELVLLREEIDFINDYFSLLLIRFGNSVKLDIRVEDSLYDDYLIPPISLQILVENAIKHNDFSETQPLTITITLEHESVIVLNRVSKKDIRKGATGIGLLNLKERYKLLTGNEVSIESKEPYFCVAMPLLPNK